MQGAKGEIILRAHLKSVFLQSVVISTGHGFLARRAASGAAHMSWTCVTTPYMLIAYWVVPNPKPFYFNP